MPIVLETHPSDVAVVAAAVAVAVDSFLGSFAKSFV